MTKARQTRLNPVSIEPFCGLKKMRHGFEEDKIRLGCNSVQN